MPIEEAGLCTYCVQCLSGQEGGVLRMLAKYGYDAMCPVEVNIDRRKEQEGRYRNRKLIPGYVFFNAAAGTEPDWAAVRRIQNVVRVLQYDDGTRAFRDEDLAFVRWLQKTGGQVSVSRVVREGSRIRVIDGFLKYYEGRIVEVRKRRNQAVVEVSESGHIRRVVCPIEYVEEIE